MTTYSQRWKAKQRAAGKCINCTRASVRFAYCNMCRAAKSARDRAKRGKA